MLRVELLSRSRVGHLSGVTKSITITSIRTMTTTCSFAFPPSPTPSVVIRGSQEKYPVHRIYCVGRNYADHVREMGGDPNRTKPVFFTKPADAVVETKTPIPYPLGTLNLHYEVELVIAIGKDGVNIPAERASNHIFGFATGIDLTRRDLQSLAKAKGLPWDAAKGLDQGAPISSITRSTTINSSSKITLTVNGEEKQSGTLNQMIWTTEEIISQLSTKFRLRAGDLIFTGTPQGVGALKVGDHVKGEIDGLEDIEFTLVE